MSELSTAGGIEVVPFKHQTVAYIERIRSRIDEAPDYQREGNVWTKAKQQLFIDSLLNDFDIPKIYLHSLQSSMNEKVYAIVDGRQRLTAIWDFLDDKFPLSIDFCLITDAGNGESLRGLTYSQLQEHDPLLAIQFQSCSLPIYEIRTSSMSLIEEMFFRLNEGAPLSGHEKRNGKRSQVRELVGGLVDSDFFERCLPFANRRSQYSEIATKMLLFAHREDVVSTKKRDLDRFWEDSSIEPAQFSAMLELAQLSLAKMSNIFLDRDPLLRTLGMVMVYYLYFLLSRSESVDSDELREVFSKFDVWRREGSVDAVDRPEDESDFDLWQSLHAEFTRHSQSPLRQVMIRLGLIE